MKKGYFAKTKNKKYIIPRNECINKIIEHSHGIKKENLFHWKNKMETKKANEKEKDTTKNETINIDEQHNKNNKNWEVNFSPFEEVNEKKVPFCDQRPQTKDRKSSPRMIRFLNFGKINFHNLKKEA